MTTSFLYQAFGIREQECTRVRYEDNSIILEIQTRKDKLVCPQCKSRHIIRSGSHIRRIRNVPIGNKQVIMNVKVQRIECKDCGCIRNEHLHFVHGKRSYTNFLLPWTWLEAPISSLRTLGFRTAAMALSDNSVPIDHPSLKDEPRLAIVLGTEGDGLSTQVIEETDYVVRIPMWHEVDSLNVAAASAVAFWELRKR